MTSDHKMKDEARWEVICPGNYQIVTWDLEATGYHLTDGICQIGAYCPGRIALSEYVVPRKHVHPRATGINNLKKVKKNREWKLVNAQTGKVLDTVSEEVALKKFIRWLHDCKGSHEKVVIVSHGTRRLDVPLLLQALEKHRLEGKFLEIVSGYGCSYQKIKADYKDKFESLSLEGLYKEVMKSEYTAHDAYADAKAVYDTMEKLYKQPLNYDLIKECCYSHAAMKYDLQEKLSYIERLNDLSKIFCRGDDEENKKMRRKLAYFGYDVKKLQHLYATEGAETLREMLKDTVVFEENEPEENRIDIIKLTDIVIRHFQP